MMRVPMVLLFCCVAIAVVVLAPAAEAQEREYAGKYYSDETYTTVVGGKVYDCCGNVVTWGQFTHWQIWEDFPCADCFPCTQWWCMTSNPQSKRDRDAAAEIKHALRTAHGTLCKRETI